MPRFLRLPLLMGILLLMPPANLDAGEIARHEIVAAQRELQARGMYSGQADGIAGSRTAAAVRRFQHAEGLRVTGRLNRETLNRLGIPRAPVAH